MLVWQRMRNKIRQLLPKRDVEFNLKGKFSDKHDNIILIDLPTNGNLGDQALVYATEKFIKDVISNDINLVEISNAEINSSIKFLKKSLTLNDLIIWNGGGNIGTLYPSAELSRWNMFKIFPDQYIIMFPQSVYFSLSKIRFLKKSIYEYERKKNLSIYLRERKSFQFFKNNFSVSKLELVPDIVFYLENKMPIQINSKQQRTGIITLLRNDIEKNNFDNESLIELLSNFDNVTQSDTFIDDIVVDSENREKLLIKKWEEIAKYKLVVTDRLHGAIFAYLTKTPVLILPNNNWKIQSTVETWLSSVESVHLLQLDNFNDKIIFNEIDKLINTPADYVNISSNFDNLKNEINGLINND